MSFTFNWPRFSDQFHYDAIQMLNTALNKGDKPPIIADKIEVVELEMGTQPPELEIRDIGDLTVDQFRGIFRLTYSGDAHLVLQTKVQANPLNHKQPDIHLMGGSRGMLAAKHPLVVPMLLRLSHFKLSSYVVLVVSKQKGITLVFKTDPLQNVDINSTFDSIAVIQNFIQHEIEGQLRQMFREDLPGIIHRLSQQWVKAKVEAPYLNKRPPPSTTRISETMSSPGTIPSQLNVGDVGLHPQLLRKSSSPPPASRRPRSTSGMSVASGSRQVPTRSSPPIIPTTYDSSHADLDNFDPTYGLRPEGVPTKSGFKGFSALFSPNKGLADLAEETSDTGDYDQDENASFHFVDWDDTTPNFTPPQSVYSDRESSTEYETIPAVGGGTITRPRVYHSQSAIQPHSGIAAPLSKSLSSLPLNNRSLSQASILRAGAGTPVVQPRLPLSTSNPYFPDYVGLHMKSSSGEGIPGPSRIPRTAPLSYALARSLTPDSLESQPSRSSSGPTHITLSTDPTEHTPYDQDPNEYAIYMRRPATDLRRMSITSATTMHTTHTTQTSTTNMDFTTPSSPPSYSPHSLDPNISHSNSQYYAQEPAKIVLRPSINNNSIHQLSTLSHSNHTLSPYTRDLSHFTVRSVPPRVMGATGGVGMEKQQAVKAKRKRTYRLGGRKTSAPAVSALPPMVSKIPSRDITTEHLPSSPSSPTPPSEFDVSDMDRYFRTHDSIPGLPSSAAATSPNPLRLQRRQPLHPGAT